MHTLHTSDPVICVIPSIFSQFKVPVFLQNLPGLVQVFNKHINMQDTRNGVQEHPYITHKITLHIEKGNKSVCHVTEKKNFVSKYAQNTFLYHHIFFVVVVGVSIHSPYFI